MKYVFTLAAAAVLAVWGCAPRSQPEGGVFDNSVSAPLSVPADESEWRYSPEGRGLRPHTLPGGSPEEMPPPERDSEEPGPEFMLPHKANKTLRI